MATLPSFVELMASLGLSADGQRSDHDDQMRTSMSPSPPPSSAPSPALLHASTSSSSLDREKSPAIVISHYDPQSPIRDGEFKRRASAGNVRTQRFSPYTSSSRRSSVSTLSDSQSESELSVPAKTSAPRRASFNNATQTTARQANGLPRRRSEQLRIVAPPASCPISSFARRRSPQASPTSPSFAQRSRGMASEPLSPVTLPTLPPLLADSFASFTFPPVSESNEDTGASRCRSPCLSPMAVVDDDKETFVKHQQAGVRISSLCRPSAVHSFGNRQISPLA